MTEREETTVEIPAEAPDRGSLLRALRELEASQARVQQNAERVYDEKRRDLVLQLLPVLDNLERTLAAAEGASDPALVTGLRMVLAGLEGVLVRYGVERVDAVGGRFNPALHEAVCAIPVLDPAQVGAVVDQATPGYRFAGKMLRAAKVSVGVASPAMSRPPRPRDFRSL